VVFVALNMILTGQFDADISAVTIVAMVVEASAEPCFAGIFRKEVGPLAPDRLLFGAYY
jgi:hypothetical protein